MPVKSAPYKRTVPYDEAPELLGGTSCTLVDLNEPWPQPDPRWLSNRLVQVDKECEFPSCDAAATQLYDLRANRWYVCLGHITILTSGNVRTRAVAMDELRSSYMDDIIASAFGSEAVTGQRKTRLAAQTAVQPPVSNSKPLKLRRFGQL